MWGMKLILCMKMNAEVFFKMIVSLWVYVARHTQSTQNNKLTISMQYLKQNVNDEVDFLPEDFRGVCLGMPKFLVAGY